MLISPISRIPSKPALPQLPSSFAGTSSSSTHHWQIAHQGGHLLVGLFFDRFQAQQDQGFQDGSNGSQQLTCSRWSLAHRRALPLPLTLSLALLSRERGLEGPTRSRGRRLGVRSSRPDSNTQKQTLQSVWGLCGAGHSSKNSSSASCVLGGMITRVFYSLSLFHFSLFGSRGPDLRGEIYNGRRQDHFHPLDRRSPDLGSPEPSFLERTIIRINWRAASQP